MDYFNRLQDGLACESTSLHELANRFGTPLYVYSNATLQRHCKLFLEAFASHPTLACFAVKANSNLSLLKKIFSWGFGADVVSLGELERALIAGVRPEKIVFSGVGKTDQEIQRGLEIGILSFNVESENEYALISQISHRIGRRANVQLRVNPNIDAKTNPYISTGLHTTKFGISEDNVCNLASKILADPNCNLIGISCHIGSQITQLGPFKEAVDRMVSLAKQIRQMGIDIKYLDLGGGLAIQYEEIPPPALIDYANTILETVKKTDFSLILEPGRTIIGNAGVLITKVLYLKSNAKKTFVIVDAAMNDLLRPSLYQAKHKIESVANSDESKAVLVDVVGPICETSDFLGKEVSLVLPKQEDLLMVRSCGAYGFSMSSQYNSRPRAAEVLVDGSTAQLVRKRESLEDLWKLELDL